MQSVQRGDVVLALFPNSDLATSKVRPVLIIQRNALKTGLSQIVVAMITSKMSRAHHPSRVSILLNTPEGIQSGLFANSVVTTDNLATVVHSAINQVIGSLPMEDIDAALRHTLNL